MSRLLLVRHGQASAGGDDYDALSDIGHQQAGVLGNSWLTRQWQFEHVLVGPRRRHRETQQGVAEVFEAQGCPWPEPVHHQALDEHHGPQVARWLEDREQRPEDPLRLVNQQRQESIESVLKAYMAFMEDWIQATHESGPFEPWSDFRERAAVATNALTGIEGNAVAFTSGGVIAALVGEVLGLDDRAVLHLSYQVPNCGWTELRQSSEGLKLVSLNHTPEFPDPRLYTMV